MKENIIGENEIKKAIFNLLNEETSKVKREDYNRVLYKMEELENSLAETRKELRQLADCVPSGLKTLLEGRVNSISMKLDESQQTLSIMKSKIKKHKRASLTQQEDTKKK